MSPPDDEWFLDWVRQHQRWNPGPGWNHYEAEGRDVFIPWCMAFRRERVTAAEAEEASAAMAAEESRYPEHHLPRLLALIRTARARQAHAAGPSPAISNSADDRQRRRAEAVTLAYWDQLPEEGRQAYRDEVRRKSAANIAPTWLEAMAQQAAAEDAGRVDRLWPDGPALEVIRCKRRDHESGPVGASSHLIPTQPNLGPAQEAIARAQADASRNAQLHRLAKLQQAQPAKPAEPDEPTPTNVAI